MAGEKRLDLQIAAGVLRRGDAVLLVLQQGANDPSPCWAVPGGVVEAGELPHEAMIREVREETGLEVVDPGGLLYVSCNVVSTSGSRGTTFVFDVASWQGDLCPRDPDEVILDVRFLPLQEAVDKLAQLPKATMRDPIIAHLRGEVGAGALWLYRFDADVPTLVKTCTTPVARRGLRGERFTSREVRPRDPR